MSSEWAATPNQAQPWALTQGNQGYVGHQRDTALAFTWETAARALSGIQELLQRPPVQSAPVDMASFKAAYLELLDDPQVRAKLVEIANLAEDA